LRVAKSSSSAVLALRVVVIFHGTFHDDSCFSLAVPFFSMISLLMIIGIEV
jgi:hypothetical protein